MSIWFDGHVSRVEWKNFKRLASRSRRADASDLTSTSQLGGILREARETRGYDLGDIAVLMGIRVANLQAIEDGRFTDLPGTSYAAVIVRAYANFLGLEGDTLARWFRGELEAAPMPGNAAPEKAHRRSAAGNVVAIPLLMVASTLAGWSYGQSGDAIERGILDFLAGPAIAGAVAPSAETQPATLSLAALAKAPDCGDRAHESVASTFHRRPTDDVPRVADAGKLARLYGGPAALAPAARAVKAPPEPKLARAWSRHPADARRQTDAPARASRIRIPPRVARWAPAGPANSSGPLALPAIPRWNERVSKGARVYGQINHDARVVLTASGDTLIQVRDEKSSMVLTRMLRAGNSYRVPNRPGMLLRTRSIRELEFTVDGVRIPTPAGNSAERGVIRLDPDALKTQAAARWPPPVLAVTPVKKPKADG
ncbi:MAG: RodZ domain-containing protein [Alphaproteobacteria bacterium]